MTHEVTLTRAAALGAIKRVENAATTPARLAVATSRVAMVNVILLLTRIIMTGRLSVVGGSKVTTLRAWRTIQFENRPKLRVTDLIPYALNCGVLLLWSALSCGV